MLVHDTRGQPLPRFTFSRTVYPVHGGDYRCTLCNKETEADLCTKKTQENATEGYTNSAHTFIIQEAGSNTMTFFSPRFLVRHAVKPSF